MPIHGTDGRDARAELLSPALLPLFDDVFIGSCDLDEEFVDRLAAGVARQLGVDAALASGPVTLDALGERCRVVPGTHRAFEWLVRTLAARGLVTIAERDGAMTVSAAAPWPALDPAEPLAAQERLDPDSLPAYRLQQAAAALWPAVLRGEADGDAALFGPDTMNLWFEYFANSNRLYAINNRVGAVAATEWLRGPVRVLELGGGLGSAALLWLEQFEAAGRATDIVRYHFTEIAPLFLRRGQRALAPRFAPGVLTTARVDMDRPFAEQGIEPGSFDAVYLVNALHVAHDLAFTLGEIRAALAPGGLLLVAECIRPWPRHPVYVEFVFDLLGAFRSPKTDPDLRPTGGFLTIEQWRRAFEAAGFERFEVMPDVTRLRDVYPSFVVGAVGARAPRP